MRVRMTQTRRGSPDGITVRVYESGQVYDLPDSLAKPFLAEKWAEVLIERPAENKVDAPQEPPFTRRRR